MACECDNMLDRSTTQVGFAEQPPSMKTGDIVVVSQA